MHQPYFVRGCLLCSPAVALSTCSAERILFGFSPILSHQYLQYKSQVLLLYTYVNIINTIPSRRISIFAIRYRYPLPRKGCLAKECCHAALLRRGSCCLLRAAPVCSGLLARQSGPRRELSSKVTADPGRPRARAPAPPTSCTTSCSRATRGPCPCATSTAVAPPRDQTLHAAWQMPSVVARDGVQGAARPLRPPPRMLAANVAHGLIKRV